LPTSYTAITFRMRDRAIACTSRSRRACASGVLAVLAQQLDRDVAAQLGIVRRVDDSHAAFAEISGDAKAIDRRIERELRALQCCRRFRRRRTGAARRERE
jgi:hypothetical protein